MVSSKFHPVSYDISGWCTWDSIQRFTIQETLRMKLLLLESNDTLAFKGVSCNPFLEILLADHVDIFGLMPMSSPSWIMSTTVNTMLWVSIFFSLMHGNVNLLLSFSNVLYFSSSTLTAISQKLSVTFFRYYQ